MPTLTMKDIAQRAGVAQPTVSKVLNNKDQEISAATRARVLEVAKKYNFQPNRFAQSLKTGKTNIIGVITVGTGKMSQFEDPYINQLYLGINQIMSDKGYKLIFHHSEDKKGALELIDSKTVDGIIFLLLGRRKLDKVKKDLFGLTDNIAIPQIIIHSLNDDFGVHAVGLNCIKGGALAAEHFIEHGYHNQGTIGCVRRIDSMLGIHQKNMVEGFAQVLIQQKIKLDENPIFRINSQSIESGYQLATNLLIDKSQLPRALFVINDDVANGMIMKFREEGQKVPGDIALIGFNDVTPRVNTVNGLTSVKQPGFEKGSIAAEKLVELLQNPQNISKPYLKLLEPTLTIRKSCGCK